MKAKRLRDGKIVEVEKHGDAMIDEDGNVLYFDEICEIDEPDWQQVRIDAAVKLTRALSENMLGAGYSERQIVKQAVELADALVEELQKKGGEDAR